MPNGAARKADALFLDKQYNDALPYYSELINQVANSEIKDQWSLRLAACYMEEKQPEKALDVLASFSNPLFQNDKFLLMGLSYRQMKKENQAFLLLAQCDRKASKKNHHLISLEQGYLLKEMKDFEKAIEILESIPIEIENPITYALAQVQLAKIRLSLHQYHLVLQNLDTLSSYTSHPLLKIEELILRGWTSLKMQREEEAIEYFEKLYPKAIVTQAPWSVSLLSCLISSYFKQILKKKPSEKNEIEILLFKAKQSLKILLEKAPSENSYLLLSDYYLLKGKCLGDKKAYFKAKELLDKTELFPSTERSEQILLKKASANESYPHRISEYERIGESKEYSANFRAQAWFFKGLEDLEEGMKQGNKMDFHRYPFLLNQAIGAFDRALQFENEISTEQRATLLKAKALVHLFLSDSNSFKQAWLILQKLLTHPFLMEAVQSPEDILFLNCWIALNLNDKEILQKAKADLFQHAPSIPHCKLLFLKLEGLMHLQLLEYPKAEIIFKQIVNNRDYFSSNGEAYFWLAHLAEQKKDENLRKDYLYLAYTVEPQNPFAPLAYFYFYSLRDYMQGHRQPIKHLQAMPNLFPNHPLTMVAHYIIGLYQKKEHFTNEGNLKKRKDYISAIDAYLAVESTFENLYKKNLIPFQELPFYIQLRCQAQFERAQANFQIAQASSSGKKQIYLEYAKEEFNKLINEFKTKGTLVNKCLVNTHSPYPQIWSEAELCLAKIYEEKNQLNRSREIVDKSLEQYQMSHIIQGAGLMKTWFARGKIAQKEKKHEEALHCFLEAEKAGKDHAGISSHEKLELWIEQSHCYKFLKRFDHAMILLSRVINEDVISPLRMRAMFLRAEIYELQGRPELSIKQLEAIVRKGGKWSEKAKSKLEQKYGY